MRVMPRVLPLFSKPKLIGRRLDCKVEVDVLDCRKVGDLMNLQLRIDVSKRKNHKDKLLICFDVLKIANECPKIDESVMKIERDEEDCCRIWLFGEYKFPFNMRNISEDDLTSRGFEMENDQKFQKLLSENFKDDTEAALKDCPQYRGRVFRKDFEYA